MKPRYELKACADGEFLKKKKEAVKINDKFLRHSA